MNTRSRIKQTAATRVPSPAAVSTGDAVSEVMDPLTPVRRTTRSSSKRGTKIVPEQKLKKAPANPKVKKKVHVRKKPVTTEDERFEDVTDSEIDSEESSAEIESEIESNSELERLRQRVAELEKVPQNPQFQAGVESTDRHKSDSLQKRSKPSEGRILGTYDGKTHLDTFLVHLESCGQYFSWSDADKKFHLINSLTGRAGSIVKEVGPDGTLERTLELLQIRFGNRARRAKFLHELQTRKRKPQETLQELFLALCESRMNAFGDDPDEQYPEAYFRDIFVDALNDKELRRSILIQKPTTMAAAYNKAVEIEAIVAYPTPLADPSRVKPKFRQLDRDLVNSPEFLKVTETQTQMVGNKRLGELKELVRAQNAVMNEMRQIIESLRHESSQTIPRPMQNPGSEESSDKTYNTIQYNTIQILSQNLSNNDDSEAVVVVVVDGFTTYGGESVNNHRNSSIPSARSNRLTGRGQCYSCGINGHYSRDFKNPRRRDENSTSPKNGGSRSEKNPARRCGSVPGTVRDDICRLKYDEKHI